MGQRFGRKGQRQSGVAALIGGLAAVGFSLWAASAQAAQLQFWRYSSAQNRIEFATNSDIRPKVQIIPNPVRLVVDLPGVQLNKPTVTQTYNAAVKSIRVGQFDAQTARIVVELATGYTVDPNLVKVSGSSPSSWAIDLPTPVVLSVADAAAAESPQSVSVTDSSPAASTVSSPVLSSPTPAAALPPATGQQTGNLLEDIVITPDGLFLKTSTAVKNTELRRSGQQISVRMQGVSASSQFAQQYSMSYHGIQQLSIRQLSAQPPVTQVTLLVDRRGPSWSASASRFGGIVLVPRTGTTITPGIQRPTDSISILQKKTLGDVPQSTPRPTFSSPQLASSQTATVQNLSLGGSQFLVQASRPVVFTSGWEGPQYRITVRNAQPALGLRTPQTGIGSALSNVEVRQDGSNFSILVTPAPGVRISTISRVGTQTAILTLLRAGMDPQVSQTTPVQPLTLPTPTGRRIVVIDPGHGNIDPGAIGIGGLKETDVVLAIALEVTRLLQQQGIQVYMTRTDESRDVDLPPRVALAEQVRANVFVSIHANSIDLTRPDVNGVETYYAPGSTKGADLAQTILSSITSTVNIPSRGMHSARFYVIRKTSMPSTLIETGFVTGAQDAQRLGDPAFRQQMATAIARGIIEYLNRR
jgi:N-acetylmuramoyl-L-alanine amidase